MHGLTGGDWKRVAARGTAPVPDPTHSLADQLIQGYLGVSGQSRALVKPS